MKNEAIEAMVTSVEYMDNIIKAIPEIVKLYRTGDLKKAFLDMVLLSEGLQWLNEVFKLTSEFNNINASEVKEIYIEFIEALENEDMVLIADLLEYELLPKVEEWQTSLNISISSYDN